MTPVLLWAWEIGCFHVLTMPTERFFWVEWCCVLFGAAVWLLLRRYSTKVIRKIFIAFLLAVLLLLEICCQLITGWDVFFYIILYMAVFFLFAGILLAVLAEKIWSHTGKKDS